MTKKAYKGHSIHNLPLTWQINETKGGNMLMNLKHYSRNT